LSTKKQEKQTTLGCPAAHFAGLVPDEVISAYTKLAAAGRLPKEEAADFLGDPQLVEELGKWGMAHIVPHTASSPPSYRAVSPDLALMGVLGVWQAKLAHQHKLVYDGYHRLVAAQALPTMSADQVPAHLIQGAHGNGRDHSGVDGPDQRRTSRPHDAGNRGCTAPV
jgi:hypothetical protein